MPKKQGGHLTMKDRRDIEDRLHDGESLNSIASHLKVSWPTVADEVKRHRTPVSYTHLLEGNREALHQRSPSRAAANSSTFWKSL